MRVRELKSHANQTVVESVARKFEELRSTSVAKVRPTVQVAAAKTFLHVRVHINVVQPI
eukprot:SAG31_NODE_1909_length_6946_cov_8.032715_2_plen_59_part_00